MVKIIDPPSGDYPRLSDYEGRLLAIFPLRVESFTTRNGTSDVVRSRLVVLDANPLIEHDDFIVFPKVIVGRLRQAADPTGESAVIGRLVRGEASPGQSPPWLLADRTGRDEPIVAAWLSGLDGSASGRDGQAPAGDQPWGAWGEPKGQPEPPF